MQAAPPVPAGNPRVPASPTPQAPPPCHLCCSLSPRSHPAFWPAARAAHADGRVGDASVVHSARVDWGPCGRAGKGNVSVFVTLGRRGERRRRSQLRPLAPLPCPAAVLPAVLPAAPVTLLEVVGVNRRDVHKVLVHPYCFCTTRRGGGAAWVGSRPCPRAAAGCGTAALAPPRPAPLA